VETFPGSARVLHWAGRAAYRAKRYDIASARFAESARLSPHWHNDLWRGKALTQDGRFDEAEALLLPLIAGHPHCRKEVAWLFERRKEHARALEHAEAHLASFPNDALVQEQVKRLRARELEPGELAEEVEALAAVGEEVEEGLLPQYVEDLLAAGRTADARRVVEARAPGLRPGTRLSVGWKAYFGQAYDLAFELFLESLPAQAENPKFLNSLQKAARLAGRLETLLAAYEEVAEQAPRLYGRIKKLEKRLTDE